MYKVETYLDEGNMPYIVKEQMAYATDIRQIYNDADKIYGLCKEMRMTERATEMCVMLVFDSAGHAIAMRELSTGSVDRSVMSPREIAMTMLLTGGVACILVHNHPSGEVEPSDIDIMTTKRIKEGLEILGLTLWDHMVVGRYGYTSMAERGLF